LRGGKNMIIDVHTHVHKYPEQFTKEMAEAFMIKGTKRKAWFAPERNWRIEDCDFALTDLIKHMDESGVDKACILPFHAKPFKTNVPNEWAAEQIEKYPDRLIGIANCDPIGGLKAVKEIDKAIDKFGFRGVKLFLTYEKLKLNDKRIWPVWERIQELDVPVLVHTGGFSPRPTAPSEWQNPTLLDEVGNAFPDLKLVMCHSGHTWYQQAAMICSYYDNFYLETAYWEPIMPMELNVRSLVLFKYLGLINRVLFGSDWKWASQERAIRMYKKIPAECKRMGLEPSITDEDINGILGGNAAKLLGIA
jgi:predicted TIM-barrel fold metal-dependent hydrolase